MSFIRNNCFLREKWLTLRRIRKACNRVGQFLFLFLFLFIMNALSNAQMECVIGGKASTMCGLSLFFVGVSIAGLVAATIAIPPMSAVVFASAGEAVGFASAFLGAGGSLGSAFMECL